jgi:hypothetical protein
VTPGIVIALAFGAALMLVVLVMAWRGPSTGLRRVERQVGALRSDIAGYRAAQQNETSSLDRRLLGLEQTTARAANEVRMVSDQMLARLPEPTIGDFEPGR